MSLQYGSGMETTLMSDEEKRLLWNLPFFLAWKHGKAEAYYAIRSFITFHGIFMRPGLGIGGGDSNF